MYIKRHNLYVKVHNVTFTLESPGLLRKRKNCRSTLQIYSCAVPKAPPEMLLPTIFWKIFNMLFNKNKSAVYPLGQPASVLIIFEKLAHTPQQQNLIEIRTTGLRNRKKS